VTTAPMHWPRGHIQDLLRYALRANLVILSGIAILLLAEQWGSEWSATTAVPGSGVAATDSRTVPPFTAVDLAGSNHVTIHVGEKQAVVVEADDNLIDLVTTEVRSGTLVLGTNGSFTTKHPMTVEVTVPTLDAVLLSGSGVVTVEGVGAEQLTVRVPGSGLLRVSGTAERLDVSLSGSGDVQLQDLVARDVVATLSGSGRLQVHATGSLDASLPGTGVIVYAGDPGNVTRNVTGTGAITKR
jgi:hypothetical protein